MESVPKTCAVQPPPYDPSLPGAIICDIDGTLAHMNDRDPYDWHRVGEYDIDHAVNDVIESVANYLKAAKLSCSVNEMQCAALRLNPGLPSTQWAITLSSYDLGLICARTRL